MRFPDALRVGSRSSPRRSAGEAVVEDGRTYVSYPAKRIEPERQEALTAPDDAKE